MPEQYIEAFQANDKSDYIIYISGAFFVISFIVFTVIGIMIDTFKIANNIIKHNSLALQEATTRESALKESALTESAIKSTVVSKKGNIMTPKQAIHRKQQLSMDICFHNRMIAIYNMKSLAATCSKILNNVSEKMDLSLEQIHKVRKDLAYANLKIKKYINKSVDHPYVHILEALAYDKSPNSLS